MADHRLQNRYRLTGPCTFVPRAAEDVPARSCQRGRSRCNHCDPARQRSGREVMSTMIASPFLTDIDPQAAIKGSRDPLGIQPIWTRLGRHVVGNLTTVSNSIRDFTTLLLGYYFAERLADELGPGTELSTFLKWEQLAAYARTVGNNDTGFRGTERVQKQLAEGHGSRVPLSQDRAYQILGNQKIYGLWGLY